ncbi:MAG TPA: EAL domain-containing protein [Thermoanaerobaculia bacterium]|nr:EAL domain-containing protein [Thermoanaerobaculia bacterium]
MSALEKILAPGGITPVYQPIVDASTESLAGYECLSRGPKGTNFESAKVLFEYVRLKHEEPLVDRACIRAALANAPAHAPVQLTVNVHASTLVRDREFAGFLCGAAKEHGIACERMTIEIVEHAPSWDGATLVAALDQLRNTGMRVSLDDIGLGQSNFKMILDVRPDFLKIDRYFVESCHLDRNRRAVIESLAHLASHFGAELVAEGVDCAETVDALRGLGVSLMQGNWFGAPMECGGTAAAFKRDSG